jgi:hypothetical protein
VRRFVDWWERRFLPLELLTAALLTAGFIIWYYRTGGALQIEEVLNSNRSEVYGSLAGVFGALLGFVITAVSIVLGYAENDRLKIVRNSPYYGTLWEVFKSTMKWLAAATIVALLGLIFDRDNSPVPALLFLTVLASLIAALRVSRSIWVLENIIRIVTKPRG